MRAVVQHMAGGARVELCFDGPSPEDGGTPPLLHWGMYRASGGQWYHPKEAVPPGSNLDAATGGMRTPMSWRGDTREWTTTLDVPSKLLPLHVAAVFYYPDRGTYEVPPRARYFSVPVGMSAGHAEPQGATIVSASPPGARPEEATCMVNFSLFSRHASAVYLCLVRVQPNDQPGATALQGSGILEIALDPVTNRTGDMWHVCVHGLKNIGLMCYGWRADGDVTWEDGGRFHPGYILCDPYVSRVVPVLLPEAAYTAAPKMLPTYNLKQPVMLGTLAAFTQTFDWAGAHGPVRGGARKAYSLEEQVVLEVDIAAWTTGPDAEKVVPKERQGKYLGMLDRLQEIVKLGVTTVVLGPVCQCAPGIGAWGRNPTNFFAPDIKYAINGPMNAANELKMMIRAMHAAGLEVIMGIEFCITAEGSDAMSGGLQGMRGIDAAVYYRTLPDRTSVLAAGHPVVRKVIVDALRHWATEYRVDGFCIANAENLSQDRFGSVLDSPPLAEDIARDPELRGLKLVAAPSNNALLPRGGVRGFPHYAQWAQVNDRFKSDMWAYLVDGQPGLLSAVATRISGSADLFAPQWDASPSHPGNLAAGRRAAFGLNNLSGLGGQGLLKALGSDSNLERAEVLARTLLLAQFVSCGVPMVSSATVARKGLWRFVSVLAAIRRDNVALMNPPIDFAPEKPGVPVFRKLSWHSAAPGGTVDWQNTQGGAVPSNVIAFSVAEVSGKGMFCVFNPYNEPVTVALPGPEGGGQWRLVVDTSRMPPEDADLDGPLLPPGQPLAEVGPKAAMLLLSVKSGATSARTPPSAPRASAAPMPLPPMPGSPGPYPPSP